MTTTPFHESLCRVAKQLFIDLPYAPPCSFSLELRDFLPSATDSVETLYQYECEIIRHLAIAGAEMKYGMATLWDLSESQFQDIQRILQAIGWDMQRDALVVSIRISRIDNG